MPKLYGFSITEFIHYHPEPNTIAISFNPLISYLLDVNQDNLQQLFNENKEVMDYLKNI